jgi:hypothetical protein
MRSRVTLSAFANLVAGVVAFGCAADARAPTAPPEPSATTGAPPTPLAAQQASAKPSETPAKPTTEPVAPPPVAFPPADFAPPSERSAKPGDGKWLPLGDRAHGELAAEAPRLLYKAVVHPHQVSRFISVTVVAIDLSRASLHLVAGTVEPISAAVSKSERTGLVPLEHQSSLLAVFNGGYKAAHGGWGMMLDKKMFVPPRDTGCTLALYADGSARLRSWPALAATQPEMTAFRQTPPCLVEQGELHPDLRANREAAWGGRVPNIKTRHRSAIGVDRSGRVLFYGLGEEAEPTMLAEGMRAAGAVDAAQLDINYYFTRFLVFGKPTPDAELQVTSPLIPRMQFGRRAYVEKAEARDFFYVRRR